MTSRSIQIVAVLVAMAAFGVVGGCNIATPIFFAVVGPPKESAVYDLDGNRTTVILIDDRQSKLPRRELRNLIATTAEQELLRKKVIANGKLISARSAAAAAVSASDSGSGGAADNPISIVDVGRRVGAAVVIYAEVTDWTLFSSGDSVSPRAALSIRIVDAERNVRLFPEEGALPLVTQLPEERAIAPGSGNRSATERALATTMGVQLAKLFYEHERTPLQEKRPGAGM